MSEVKLISHTLGAGELEGKSPQDVISYVARVVQPTQPGELSHSRWTAEVLHQASALEHL
jgi:hypothetical protein